MSTVYLYVKYYITRNNLFILELQNLFKDLLGLGAPGGAVG